MRKIVYSLLSGTLLLAGCSIQKPVVEEKITPELLGSEIELADSLLKKDWKEIFTDAPLQALISEALEKNSDIRIMALNVEQAESYMRMAKLSYVPSFALAPSGTASILPDVAVTKIYDLPLTMNWELNLAGKQTAQKNAAKNEWLSSQERFKSTQIQLITAVANAYYTLVMLDEQIALSQENVSVRRNTLETIKAMKSIGKMNELAVKQTESLLEGTLIDLKEMELKREKVERTLDLLLARYPGVVERSSYEDCKDIIIDAEAPVSLESLAGRPDVKSAEYALRSMFNNTQIARSQFYPTLQINASGTWTNNIGEIVNPGRLLINLIGGLTQPLFQGRRLKTNLEVAKAQQEQAQITFEQTLLEAGSEVIDALAECKLSKERAAMRAIQTASCLAAFQTSQELLHHSTSVSYLEVLTAQETYLDSRIVNAADWLLQKQSKLNLYKALCP